MTIVRPIRLFVASAIVIVAMTAATVTPWLASVTGESPLVNAASSVGAVMLAVVGALVLVRRPGNRMGAVFSLAGVLWAVGAACDRYASWVYEVRGEPLPGGLFAVWVSEWFWIPWLFLVFVFTALLFPTGHLPSRRWRPVAWMAGVTAVVITGLAMLESELAYSGAEVAVHNPFGISGHADVEEGVLGMWLLIFFSSTLASLASLIMRYRRAKAAERQQIKLVTYAACILVAGFFVGAFGDVLFGFKLPVVESLLNAVLPAAAGVAILKHRLFDIDLVISRSLVFAGLAAFITAIYVGIVVGLGTLLGTGDEPNLALSIVATAVVATAFQPVRERLTRIANRLVFGHRATPYEVLSSFAGDLAQTATPASTLERMAKLVADGTGADRVSVWLRVGETARAAAVWPEVFLIEPIPDRDLGDPTVFADFDHIEEVVHDGELLGAITLSEPRGEVLNHTEHELLSDLAGQAALLLRNLRLTEELHARIDDLHSSRRRLVRAQDDERRRLERDLHDGAQRRLAELTGAVRSATESAEREGAIQVASLLAQVAADGEEAIRTVRDLAHGIYPPILAAEGLPGALAIQAARAAVPVTIEADGLGRYEPDIEAAVYFCVLEAVNNAAKHARPSQVSVRLAATNGDLTFEVSDDGDGFDPSITPFGYGTTNMADRLDALGGALALDSEPGRGTVVSGRLPVEHDRSKIGTRR